jgi:hypothetical protein
VFADEKEIQRWRADDNLCSRLCQFRSSASPHRLKLTGVRIQLSVVQVLDNSLDGLNGPVPIVIISSTKLCMEGFNVGESRG